MGETNATMIVETPGTKDGGDHTMMQVAVKESEGVTRVGKARRRKGRKELPV